MANRYSRKARKNRKSTHRKNRRMNYRKMYGGDPASTTGDSMSEMQAQSLAQGQQFAGYHVNQHGGAGALEGGPFPGVVVQPSLIPSNMMNAARVAPLNAALDAIANMKDPGQAGGRRRNRKGSRKHRKANRKNRRAGCPRKDRKNRRNTRKGRRNMRGGVWSTSDAQSVSASGMLLSPSLEAKALSGMNAEWKLAENPNSFAPGYKTY